MVHTWRYLSIFTSLEPWSHKDLRLSAFPFACQIRHIIPR